MLTFEGISEFFVIFLNKIFIIYTIRGNDLCIGLLGINTIACGAHECVQTVGFAFSAFGVTGAVFKRFRLFDLGSVKNIALMIFQDCLKT